MNKSPGRPRGTSDAKDRILSAARDRFEREGYTETSVRAIARDAGVDHALVNYHFGSKEGLFGAVMALHRTPAEVIENVLANLPADQVPGRLVAEILDTWGDPASADPLRRMLQEAARTPALTGLVAGYIQDTLIHRLETLIPGRYSRQRATAAGMAIAGLVLGRYVFEAPAFTALTRKEVIAFYTPVLAAALGLAGAPGARRGGAGAGLRRGDPR